MNLTKLFLGSLLLTTSLNAEPLDRVVPEGRLSLRDVIHAVAESNPSVKAAEAKWLAMKARVPQAAAWEDLRLRGESVVARFVNIPPNGFTDQTVALEQELPLTGKIRRVFGKRWSVTGQVVWSCKATKPLTSKE